MVHIVYIERNIHIFLIYSIVYLHLLLNIVTACKVSMKIDFQKMKLWPYCMEPFNYLDSCFGEWHP